jgi:hypothetical protein
MLKQIMKLFAKLACKVMLEIIICAQRAAIMLFVLNVRNVCSRIKTKLPEEFLQFMNSVKTIFSAIAATKKLCSWIHFSGTVILASGTAALIACQLPTGNLNTTLNFFC